VELEEQTASGPVIFAGRIVQAAASGRVTALAAEDGSRVWSADLGDAVHGSGVAAGGGLVFALAGGQLASLDPQGNLLWKVRLQDAPSAPPSACGDLVFAGTQAGTLEAFTAGSGVRKWVYRAGGAVRSRVLCHRGRLYFGTADDRFHCIRPEGRRKWSFRVGGDVTATPLAEGRRVYFLCYDNYLYVLKARSGHLLTQVRLSHRLSEDALRLGDALLLSPHTSGRISMLSLPALGLVAEFPLELAGDWFTTPPAAAGDRILVGYGRTEGRVLALRLERKPAEPPGAR
jgi:outer membrane protein assembly factor BamB